MNFATPAQCSGTVTWWNYCYLRQSSGTRFGVKFMVYRETDQTRVYSVVPRSLHTLVLEYSDLQASGCRREMLNANQQFQVLPNDILAACIFRNSSTEPLFMIDGSDRQAYRIRDVSDDCIDNELSTVNVNRLGSNDMLLLRANIRKFKYNCLLGSNF